MFTVTTADLELAVATLVYPFLRVLALMSSAPVLSHRSVPRTARIGFAFLVALLIAPTLPQGGAVSPFSAAGVLLVIQQVVVGVAIGLVMQAVFAAADVAGELVGLQMGLSFGSFVDAQNSDPSPIVASFLTLTLMLVFLGVDGHLLMIAALVDTFQTFPVAPSTPFSPLDAGALARVGRELFATGLMLALPVVAAMLLANLALGVLVRTAPQLNLFAVGFPVTLTVGLGMLALSLPFVVPAMEQALLRGFALLPR
ncbi:MAG: flagellar biosynthetic protein FliR [Burkholderiales bacterium]|nr:flagellar biosynthetic protein FliR [Burkholderiales bacterium]GIK86580.1 MAG: flagellar biosynthetic protein FliR [Betaproteobacteria bacterium]